MADVEWRQIKEFPDYEVSDGGRVRRRATGRVLRSQSYGGTWCVSLNHPYHTVKSLPRLVWEAFVGSVGKGHKLVHKNGVAHDCRLENLEKRPVFFSKKRAAHRGRERAAATCPDWQEETYD